MECTKMKAYCAETIGTFWLVFGGCGSAVLAGSQIGTLGISFAFGLTVLTMAYAIGHISGCHLNPAVTLGLTAAGKFDKKLVPGYIAAQVIGAIIATGLLAFILGGTSSGLAANGYAELSPGGYSMIAAFVMEVVLTFMFLYIILGATSENAPKGFAPIAIGLGLTLIHLIGIPVTNLSVNPARSMGPALFVGGVALQQVWLFWVAPILGAVAAGFVKRKCCA